MIEKLKELKDKYKEVRELQYQIKKEFRGKEIEVDNTEDKFFFDENCSNIRINLIDVADDNVEVLYLYKEDDGELVECVDWIDIDDFIKYVKLK